LIWIAAAGAAEVTSINDYLAGLDATGLTGVVQVYDGDHVTHAWARGRDVGGAPLDGASLFWIGSISKHLAALAVLKQVEAGAARLDAPVASYFDEVPAGALALGGEVCTLERLLSHTCGLPRDGQKAGLPPLDEGDPASASAWVAAAGALSLDFPPGSDRRYSNLGYALAGLLVERLSGAPYEEALQALVAPTGLGPITARPGPGHGFPERLAPGSGPLFGAWPGSAAWMGIPPDFPSTVGASGNALASASALGPWFRAVIQGALPPELQAELLRPRVRGYALGVLEDRGYGEGVFWHNGALAPAGYSSFVAHALERDLTVVVLSNQEAAAISPDDVGGALLDLARGQPAAAPAARELLGPSVLTALFIGLTRLSPLVMLAAAATGRGGGRLNWALGYAVLPWVVGLMGGALGLAVSPLAIAAGAAGIALGLTRRRARPLWVGGPAALVSLALSVGVCLFLVRALGGGWSLLAWVAAAAGLVAASEALRRRAAPGVGGAD